MTDSQLPIEPVPTEPVSAPPAFPRRLAHPDRRRIAAIVVAVLAIVASAAVAMGASPGASPSTDPSVAPDTTAAPQASAAPKGPDAWPFKGGAPFDGMFRMGRGPGGDDFPGIVRRGGVEITAIDGSELSLETVDGWTRTITVTSDTAITKGGDTIQVDDLAVGDQIRFRQERNDDGTFTITQIAVVEPHVAGTVTGKGDATITVEQRDGTSVTVHVDASTSFRVEGAPGTADIDDVESGMVIVASGELNADGSLNASRVLAGTERPFGHHEKHAPDASPAPDASADPG